jgi:hypothetical protein
VYIKNGNIIFKSNTRTNLFPDASEVWCWFSINDNLIFEDWQVRIYEKSKQFEKDIHKYRLSKQIESLEFQNDKLEKIANEKIKKKTLTKEPTKYDRDLYLLRQMKWLQPL